MDTEANPAAAAPGSTPAPEIPGAEKKVTFAVAEEPVAELPASTAPVPVVEPAPAANAASAAHVRTKNVPRTPAPLPVRSAAKTDGAAHHIAPPSASVQTEIGASVAQPVSHGFTKTEERILFCLCILYESRNESDIQRWAGAFKRYMELYHDAKTSNTVIALEKKLDIKGLGATLTEMMSAFQKTYATEEKRTPERKRVLRAQMATDFRWEVLRAQVEFQCDVSE